MRKRYLLILIGLFLTMGLPACHTDEVSVAMPVQPMRTSTVTVIDGETIDVSPMQPEIVVALPTADFMVDDEPSATARLDCEEVFCQVPWPGWLQRPFGEGDTQTIDRSYPYASTGDGTLDPHHGVEFPNKFGTPVLAAHHGQVIFAGADLATRFGPFLGFYGNVVILSHTRLLNDERDVYTLYAHLSEIMVKVGDQVESGEVIGEVGATGAAIGQHLHFEVRLDANDYDHTVNPALWFAPLDDPGHGGTATLAGIILDEKGDPLPELQLTLERVSKEGVVEKVYYPKTYYPITMESQSLLGENFAIPDLPAGNYRLAFITGILFEFSFNLEPGSLGFITFQQPPYTND
jgi:hypothetical protein